MFNQEIFKGKWTEFKGGVRNIWGRLTDDDVERTKGNLTSLTGVIQTKYGETVDSVKKKLDQLLSSFDNETDRSKQDLNQSSYQRRPVDDEESNFSVGRDFDESERNFNSSSEAVGGTKNFPQETGDEDRSISL